MTAWLPKGSGEPLFGLPILLTPIHIPWVNLVQRPR